MDGLHQVWYYSDRMSQNSFPKAKVAQTIPVWNLYGEDSAFPDVLHIETIQNRAAGLDWKIALHRHSHLHQFFLIKEGEVRIELDGETILQAPPFLLNVPAGCIHGFTFAAGTEGWVLTLPLLSLPELLDPTAAGTTALGQARIIPCTSVMADLFARIAQEHAATNTARPVMLRALAAQLSCLVLREMGQAADIGAENLDPRLLQFFALLDLHLRDPWRLADYAAAIGISERHLGRLCRMATGHPPTLIIEAAVIREACRLLVYTRAPIAAIGYGLGFDDPSYFSRVFRRVMGLSPANYRAGFERDPG